jgi:hypothetical protein
MTTDCPKFKRFKHLSILPFGVLVAKEIAEPTLIIARFVFG